jgi:hypothetical protein
MLLQTNSYVVPKEKRVEHARLLRRFKQALARLGCDQFEVYEQVGTNWTSDQTSGRFVQIMRFRDRKQQLAIQAAERSDPSCQAIIAEFCELINYPYQQQQGLFAIGYYSSVLTPARALPHEQPAAETSGPTPLVTPAVETIAPVAQEIQFGETPVEVPAEAPFAEATLVSDIGPQNGDAASEEEDLFAEATDGKNGDAAREATAETESGVESLDELIKRRFGAIEISPPAEPAERTLPPEESNGEHISPPPTGSGIGEVLNAISDDDFDFVLPGEPLDSATSHEAVNSDPHSSASETGQH